MMVSAGLLLNSCYYDDIQELDPTGGGGGGTTVISYQNDIVPLWNECTSCHGQTKPILSPNSYANLLNGYVVANNANASILYKALIGNGAPLMPPGSQWPASKINLVKNWINQGALDN